MLIFQRKKKKSGCENGNGSRQPPVIASLMKRKHDTQEGKPLLQQTPLWGQLPESPTRGAPNWPATLCPCFLSSYLEARRTLPSPQSPSIHSFCFTSTVFPVSFRGAGAPGGSDGHQTLSNLPAVTTEVTSRILIIDGYITGYLRTL